VAACRPEYRELFSLGGNYIVHWWTSERCCKQLERILIKHIIELLLQSFSLSVYVRIIGQFQVWFFFLNELFLPRNTYVIVRCTLGWAENKRKLLFSRNSGEYCSLLYGPKRTAVTRSAITPPKVNRFGRNLEYCEPNVGDWPWQILDAIRTAATVQDGTEILFFFVRWITHDFIDFLSDKLYDIWTQQRRSSSPCKLSEQNFDNLTSISTFSVALCIFVTGDCKDFKFDVQVECPSHSLRTTNSPW